MALQTPSILKQRYPAKEHAHRVATYLRDHHDLPSKSLLFLESAVTRMNEDNDQEAPFRQRRFFFYLTGSELPDSAVLYDTAADKLVLFIPPVDPDEVIWSGLPMSLEEVKQKYDIDAVHTTPDLPTHLEALSTTHAVYAVDSQLSDKYSPSIKSFAKHDLTSLRPALEETRAVKDPYEIALIRHANAISAYGHTAVMRAVRTATNECELEATFVQQCAHRGAKNMAYSPIVASGTDAATLHYVRNDKALRAVLATEDMSQRAGGEGDMQGEGEGPLNLLIDAGAEVRCYAADVTRTFPCSGRFTKESRSIYALVLKMQKECMGMIKAGVEWEECHRTAHRVLIAGLLELGILRGGTVDEIMVSGVSTAFLPHGLGHMLGMDTHDTGGHPDYADPDPMYRYLRIRGKLRAGNVVTNEPGCYFCRFIIEPRLKTEEGKKHIDAEVLEKYWTVGGVRIEDDVLVKKDGCENLTDVPSEIGDIEKLASAEV